MQTSNFIPVFMLGLSFAVLFMCFIKKKKKTLTYHMISFSKNL